jgi:hypothetical protein
MWVIVVFSLHCCQRQYPAIHLLGRAAESQKVDPLVGAG